MCQFFADLAREYILQFLLIFVDPSDGINNMGFEEAAECAKLVGAKHNIPVHMNPLKKFDKKKATEKWNAPNKLGYRTWTGV